MKTLKLGIAVFSLLVLIDGFLILSSGRKSYEPDQPDARVFISDVQIKEIKIRLPDGKSFSAVKTQEGWDSPSEDISQDLEKNLHNMSFDIVLESTPENLADFGLSEAERVSLSITFLDGTKTEIFFGKKLKLDVLSVYAQMGGRSEVFKVLDSFRERCIKAAEFTKKQIFQGVEMPRNIDSKIQKPVHTTTVKNVFDSILRDIRKGVYKPGVKLPSQREFVEKMGVGVGSVREALQALQGLNIITIITGKGAFVSDLDYLTYFNPSGLFICNTREDFLEHLEFRHMYELAASEVAMNKMSDEEFASLDNIVADMRKVWPDRNELIQLDVKFHETLCLFTRNRIVQGIFHNSIALYFESFSLTIKEGYEDEGMIERHGNIVKAMREKDRMMLSAAFNKLITTTFDEVTSAFPE